MIFEKNEDDLYKKTVGAVCACLHLRPRVVHRLRPASPTGPTGSGCVLWAGVRYKADLLLPTTAQRRHGMAWALGGSVSAGKLPAAVSVPTSAISVRADADMRAGISASAKLWRRIILPSAPSTSAIPVFPRPIGPWPLVRPYHQNPLSSRHPSKR